MWVGMVWLSDIVIVDLRTLWNSSMVLYGQVFRSVIYHRVICVASWVKTFDSTITIHCSGRNTVALCMAGEQFFIISKNKNRKMG
jgi:hypothetical protein